MHSCQFWRIPHLLITFPFTVTPACAEPVPGWVDNLNGPVGIMIGASKGVIRSMLCNGDFRAEVRNAPKIWTFFVTIKLSYHFRWFQWTLPSTASSQFHMPSRIRRSQRMCRCIIWPVLTKRKWLGVKWSTMERSSPMNILSRRESGIPMEQLRQTSWIIYWRCSFVTGSQLI